MCAYTSTDLGFHDLQNKINQLFSFIHAPYAASHAGISDIGSYAFNAGYASHADYAANAS